jgi:hypothetical protein
MATKKTTRRGITIKKADAYSFSVQFPVPVGPGNATAGSDVPVEWMRAALDYYIQHRQEDGSITPASHERVKPLW